MLKTPFSGKYEAADSGCIVWTGSRLPKGYGMLSIGNERWYAHRLSWTLTNQKKIPDGLCVCHSCDNPSCINPEHLFVATQAENLADMSRKGRARGNAITPPHLRARSVLSPESRNVIANSKEPTLVLARRYGVSRNCIWRTRRDRDRINDAG